jgi:hypothetical protein
LLENAKNKAVSLEQYEEAGNLKMQITEVMQRIKSLVANNP